MTKRSWTVGLFIGAASLACVGGDADSLSRRRIVDDPRYSEVQRRLNVDIRDVEFEGGGFLNEPDCNPTDGCVPETFRVLVEEWCRSRNSYCVGAIGCTRELCATETQLCVAHRLLEVVGHAASTELDVNSQLGIGTLLIPPQDAETNSELARRPSRPRPTSSPCR